LKEEIKMQEMTMDEVEQVSGGEKGVPHSDYYYSTPGADFFRNWFNGMGYPWH
jgi:hypothetical protein